MMKKMLMLIVSLILLTSLAMATDLNLTFEDNSDLANWGVFVGATGYTTKAWDANAGVDGSGALYFTDGGYGLMMERQSIAVPIDNSYSLSIDIKVADWTSANNLTVSIIGLGNVEPSAVISNMTTFTTVTLNGVADLSTSGYIRISGSGNTATPEIWIDNLVFSDDEAAAEPTSANVYTLDLSTKHYFYIDDNANNDLDVTGDFTIEAWVKFSNFTGRLFDRSGVMKLWAEPVDNSLRFDLDSGSSISTGTISVTGEWYHVAVCRSGTATTIYLDGISKAAANLSPIASDSPLYIGGQDTWFGTWNARIDEFRFSNVARYSGNFTPATTNFTDDANTILLYHFDDNTQFPPGNSSSMVFTQTNAGIIQGDYVTDRESATPITLLSFTAEAVNGMVELAWETASETNNASFVIYRDGVALTSIEGAGTSSETNAYSYLDNTVIPGVTYTYVLADVDYENNETRYDSYAVRAIVGEDEIAKSYELGVAYPNPFNPQSIIPLELRNDAMVNVSMYDTNGRLVKNMLSSHLSAGMHDIQISNENLSSGTYLVRINIDNAVNVRKVTYNK